MKRLTARRLDNGLAYLVGVKPNEQEVDSPHPNTLRCILDCFERLAAYEDTGFLPADIEVMSRAHTALRDMKNKLLAEITRLKAERDAAVEDLTRLANGHKDCGNCIRIGDSIGKCEYKHTGDCFDWRGLEVPE